MNYKYIKFKFAVDITDQICLIQTNLAHIVEDFNPTFVNQSGKKFPHVNSEGITRANISAPKAQYIPSTKEIKQKRIKLISYFLHIHLCTFN